MSVSAGDLRTYQHLCLEPIRESIDQRNLRHNSRHNELSAQ